MIVFLSLGCIVSKAQTQTIITGKILESAGKAPLSGATISLQGSTNTVVSDNDGSFKLETYKKLPLTVTVSFIGYQPKNVTINSSDYLTISLIQNPNQLSDIVILGYGTQRRKDVTGAVSSVPKENLTRLSSSFDNLLQGSVAGVVVTQSSGQPGATSNIRIRGGNSLSFGRRPRRA